MKIVIFDTNFLIANKGKIQSIISYLKCNDFKCSVPELVKDEFINNQIRSYKDTMGKIDRINESYPLLNVSYSNKLEDSIKKRYDISFLETFDEIIPLNKENLIDTLLARDKYKLAPFNKEEGSSDKGFKDTIIWLNILDYCKDNVENTIYFVTKDGAFNKYKTDLLNECNNTIEFLNVDSEEKMYVLLKIKEDKDQIVNNVFNFDDNNILDVRKRINEAMSTFNLIESEDYFGNEIIIKRYEIVNDISYSEVKDFLNNLSELIKENIFNNTIQMSDVFKNFCELKNNTYSIEIELLKEILELYNRVKNTEHLNAFINFVKNKINENVCLYEIISDEDLPF